MPSGSDHPRCTIVTGEPLGIASTACEGQSTRIPFETGLIEVALVHQVASDRTVTANHLVGDWLRPGTDAIEEVVVVVVAGVESGLGICKECPFSLLHLHRAGSVALDRRLTRLRLVEGVVGNALAIHDQDKSATVHLHFTIRTKEMDAKSMPLLPLHLVFQRYAVGVNKPAPGVCIRLLRMDHFYGTTLVHSERPLRNVKVVSPPIPNSSRAVILIGPPFLIEQFGIVGMQRSGTAPKVPVDTRWRRLVGKITGHFGRPSEATHDVADITNDSVAHQFAGDSEFLHRSLHRTGLQNTPVRIDSFHYLDSLVDVVSERFLAIDILSGAKGGEGDGGVPVVGRCDVDRINLLAGQEFPKVVMGSAVRIVVLLVNILFGEGGALCINVADCEHPCVLPSKDML